MLTKALIDRIHHFGATVGATFVLYEVHLHFDTVHPERLHAADRGVRGRDGARGHHRIGFGFDTAQAGAGVVADSVPESEWQETLNKLRALFKAAELASKGLIA